MPRTFVVNASPLILLSRVGRLDLLSSLAETVLAPAAVLQELADGQNHDDAADVVRATNSIDVVEDVPVPESVKLWDLGAGESQVLAQVLAQPGSEAVLDDLVARRCARSLDLLTIGTLGVVITCRQNDVIAAARPLVEELHVKGMRLKTTLMNDALKKVGEAR